MAAVNNVAVSVQDQIQRVRQRFEAQLLPLGLAKAQIETQTLDELQKSLERVNDAIDHPESFGIVWLKVTPDAGAVVTSSSSGSNYEIGILPMLLERKKLILDHIRLLKGEEKIENLRDLITKLPDEELRTKLEKEIEALKSESGSLLQQSKEVERIRTQEELNSRELLTRLGLETTERKAKVVQSYLTREIFATVVGCILLLALTSVEIWLVIWKNGSTESVNNMLLLILGYFFGQARTSSKSD